MSVLHRNRSVPAEPTVPAEPSAPVDVTPPPATVAPPTRANRPPAQAERPPARTRTSAAWLGICVAATLLVVLIVFMLQNTGDVEVSFLWLDGSLPLALALLIAAVGAALLTMMVGAARITQLRRRFRRNR